MSRSLNFRGSKLADGVLSRSRRIHMDLMTALGARKFEVDFDIV
jgi:hypothetical protein